MSAVVNTSVQRPEPSIIRPAEAGAEVGAGIAVEIGELTAGLAEAELSQALADLTAYHDRLQAALSELDRT